MKIKKITIDPDPYQPFRLAQGYRAGDLLFISGQAAIDGNGTMAISKESKGLGMVWEKEYGYAQAVKVADTIYLSGQVSHDDQGNIVGLKDMEAQMRQA
jgi:enamine deaminase RidA (YjgF/YER057c/UK114 family)